jgi:hypothetical protein
MPPPIKSPTTARAELTARFCHKAPDADNSTAACATAVGAGKMRAGRMPRLDAICHAASSVSGTAQVKAASRARFMPASSR